MLHIFRSMVVLLLLAPFSAWAALTCADVQKALGSSLVDVTGDARKVETSTLVITNATSLGGVDSTMESRYRWEGDRVPVNLLRLSVGLEDVDVLWADLEEALDA